MADTTPRFGLPLLQAGQAQKEVLHNEAIVTLETLCQPVAESVADVPPAAPAPGASWIVGTAPGGAWATQAGALATWTEGGWRFVSPAEGMAVRLRSSGLVVRRSDGQWITGVVAASRIEIGGRQVTGAQQPAISAPAGGSTIDVQCRTVVEQVLVALRTHGLIAS